MKNKKPIILFPSFREASPKGGNLTRVAVEASYLSPILSLDAVPLIVPLGATKEEIEELSGIADGLLLPGGGDIIPARYGEKIQETTEETSEERDELEFFPVQSFFEQKKPIFGICRGMQVLNVAMRGSLYADVAGEIQTTILHQCDKNITVFEQYGKDAHEIEIEKDSALADYFGVTKTIVNSLHHQSIKTVGDGFRIGARAPDGIIEEIESVDMNQHWLLGVQWHPEAILEHHPENKNLFEEFIGATKK
jgi:putative glutamine amidotransferase